MTPAKGEETEKEKAMSVLMDARLMDARDIKDITYPKATA